MIDEQLVFNAVKKALQSGALNETIYRVMQEISGRESVPPILPVDRMVHPRDGEESVPS